MKVLQGVFIVVHVCNIVNMSNTADMSGTDDISSSPQEHNSLPAQ